jgi:methyl-accepting chemotaxis protein
VSPTAQQTGAHPKFKRSARNYLLDARFQLKYTSYIVGLTLAVGLCLGFMLYRQANDTVAIGEEAVRVGAAANLAAVDSVKQAKSLNDVLVMSGEIAYKDDPALLSELRQNADKDNAAIAERANKVQAQEQQLLSQSAALASKRRTLIRTLAVGLSALVIFLGIAAIIITHRIVGPIFKMKRLLREVGDGKLTPPGKLRKGDELQDFFEVFAQMVDKLRARQQKEIDQVDRLLEAAKRIEVAPDSSEGAAKQGLVEQIVALKNAMQGELDAR